MEREELEKATYNDVLVKDLEGNKSVLFLVCENIERANLLSKALDEMPVSLEIFNDERNDVTFDLKLGKYGMIFWTGNKENAMYLKALRNYPDFISVGHETSPGYYNLSEMYRPLAHPFPLLCHK